MSDERFGRAAQIFLAARALPETERGQCLEHECAGDGALRAEVEAMLRGAERETPFKTLEAGLAAARGLLRAEAPEVRPLTEDERGACIGPYALVEKIGEGGFGSVYRAEQERPLRRTVALKLIKPGMDTARVVARFEAERQALALMDHAGIARVFDAGSTEAGRPYFVMELVEGGEPITTYCDKQRLTLRERLALFAEVCCAVQHAHQKGIIHRDLKPSNILVRTEEGRATVKVIDFGVAKATGANAGAAWTLRTAEGQAIGTPAYMSPEQIRSEGQDVDTRTDVYSLGVLLYELLTGSTPLDPTRPASRSPAEVERLIREVQPVRPSVRVGHGARNSGGEEMGAATKEGLAELAAHRGTDARDLRRALKGDLDCIVMKCLEKDRARRYESATALALDVERHLRHEPIVARPPSAAHRGRMFVRRNRALVTAAGLVMGAMAAATGISMWQAGVALRAKGVAEIQRRRADDGAASALREARRATLAAAAAAIDDADPIAARRLLDATDEAHRGWSWLHWRANVDQCVAMVRPAGHAAGVWLNPHADELVVVTQDGEVQRGSPWAGELRTTARLARGPLGRGVFTADGRCFIAACGAKLQSLDKFDVADGSLVEHVADLEQRAGLLEASADGAVIGVGLKTVSSSDPADEVWVWRRGAQGAPWDARQAVGRTATTGLAMSRDGRRLVSGMDSVRVWDCVGGAEEYTRAAERAALKFAASDDGALLACGGDAKVVEIRDARTGELRRSLAGHAGNITALAFDHSGRTLASAGTDLTIRLWDTATGAQLACFSGHTGRIRRLQFCDDAPILMSLSDDGSVRLWQREPYEGTCVLRGHSSYVYAVAFTPDGSRIVSGAWDQAVREWDAASGAAVRETPTAQGYVTALAVSPDSRVIATGHKVDEWGNSPVWLWDAATGRPLREACRSKGAVTGIVFSADGRRLWVAWQYYGTDLVDLTTDPPSRRPLLTHSTTLSIAVSTDEALVASGHSRGSIFLIDAASGELKRTLRGHTGGVTGLAFHPTRPLLASASMDGTARLWDLETGACVSVLDGHWDKVYAVAFSPDGRYLATGSEDTTIVLWGISRRDGRFVAEELTRLRGHGAYVYSLAFSPDGSRLVSGSGDTTVRVWDTRPVYERWRAWHGLAESDHPGAE